MRQVVFISGALLYAALFAALFSLPGGLGFNLLPDSWRDYGIAMLSAIGYVFLGLSLFCALRGKAQPFPWGAAIVGSWVAVSVVLFMKSLA